MLAADCSLDHRLQSQGDVSAHMECSPAGAILQLAGATCHAKGGAGYCRRSYSWHAACHHGIFRRQYHNGRIPGHPLSQRSTSIESSSITEGPEGSHSGFTQGSRSCSVEYSRLCIE